LISNSVIDASTVEAYRSTIYRVNGNSQIALIVDAASSALLSLHQSTNVSSSAFITAYNPCSEVVNTSENLRLQGLLAIKLKSMNLQYLEGVGQHPSNQWAGEPSFLVLGIELDAAKRLGTQFKQNAILWCGSDAVPQLVLLR
jgi:hypothetical protein